MIMIMMVMIKKMLIGVLVIKMKMKKGNPLLLMMTLPRALCAVPLEGLACHCQ